MTPPISLLLLSYFLVSLVLNGKVTGSIGRVLSGDDVPILNLSWGKADIHDLAALDAIRDVVNRLDVNAQAIGQQSLLSNAMTAITQSEWSPSWQQNVIEAARKVVLAAKALAMEYERFSHFVGLPQMPSNRLARGAIAVLARTLPQSFGRDWRFALSDSTDAIAIRLQEGTALLTTHRDLTGQLSPQWSDSVISRCRAGLKLLKLRGEIHAQIDKPWSVEVVEVLRLGLSQLEKLDQLTQQLSVQYGDQIEQLNIIQLQREWAKAEKAIWPKSWFSKRKVRTLLDQTVVSEGEPDVAKDIRLLVKIRGLHSEITALEISNEAAGVWIGLKTRPMIAKCALNFQQALSAAMQDQPWDDVGFELLDSGQCGVALGQNLARLRTLRQLDSDLKAMENLAAVTSGIWAGLATRTEHLEAALTFEANLLAVRQSGALAGDHECVASGNCGAALLNDFQRVRERGVVEQRLGGYDDLPNITANLWNGLTTHVDEVRRALKFQKSVNAAITNFSSSKEDTEAVRVSLKRLIGPNNALLEHGGEIAVAGESYLRAWGALQPTIDRLAAAGGFSDASKSEFGEFPLIELVSRCSRIEQSETRLHAWCAWRKVCEVAHAVGLAPLVQAIENAAVAQGTTGRAFATNYSRWWLNAVVDQEAVIRTFVSAEHEKRISDFRALDDRFTELTRAWVRAGLCANLPTQENVTRNSEWGILRHEMTKKKRHMPLRELMVRIPTALTKLTPCLLMSPLSIAQYLAADATTFDLVVFDEASQIPVWDAVGAIARGRQVVMVGDPKQLPPTNFFGRAESIADDEDTEGDLESILDECLGANLPTLNLAWHYRSRNESLISFSNHHYYGGSLVTFPSPVTEDRAVSFHYVNGIYEKGGARINKPEAKALVADLVERLRSPGFRESKLTIGVVTFNTEQQSLIEDLLDDERRKDPSIEPYFSEAELEPIFVKNLESVQGDERDIMYFCVTYGPDLSGAVSMNFGPMNRDGGERRLNVAITRARHELRVFSSLKAEQMDMARTKAVGVRDLKHFLEFAERGPRALAEASEARAEDFDSPFEEAVASALTKKGWQLHSQIGVSAFRVDLAVVHPDAKGIYLTGIECDGATYHRSATARDRDKLREQVLRGLGWEILRVWSTDWWIDSAGTLEKLDEKLTSLLTASRLDRAVAAEREAARLAVAVVIAKAKENGAIAARACKETGDESTLRYNASYLDIANDDSSAVSKSNDSQREKYAKNTSNTVPVRVVEYVEANPLSVVDRVEADAFFDTSYDSTLARMIAHVIEVEGPVLDSVLARRIARAHGWQRTGSRIQERVEALATKSHRATQEDVGIFYWAMNRGPEVPCVFRRTNPDITRTADEICMLELVALARSVVATGKTGDAGVAAMAHELGLQRVRAAGRGRCEAALKVVATE